ncbi:hypothetical protein [Actinoplanes sp. L3-i22]|uniref:hypothetical protein n=1 Tax=Actinoplanes sp. L3-i22 TaxID=2836373 RepID=UPI001C764A21|nr:hypothetical protein [Actinoplanes sp. L3-i22]BCY10822.1 hypothetical protein L3i22_059100 [Actinoplanes sp. L3-i22]
MAESITLSPEDRRWRDQWVPVERRFLGLDRRTLLPAGLVALLVALALWIVPGIDDAVPVDDPIHAGDVIQVGPGVEFVPVTGANLVDGLRRGAATAAAGFPDHVVLTYRGITFRVVADTYDGTPAQLLAQIKRNNEGFRGNGGFRVTGDPVTLTNSAGDRGVLAHFDGTEAKGLVAAFVLGRTGVEIIAIGPESVDESSAPAVTEMIRSVRAVAA